MYTKDAQREPWPCEASDDRDKWHRPLHYPINGQTASGRLGQLVRFLVALLSNVAFDPSDIQDDTLVLQRPGAGVQVQADLSGGE